MKVPVGEFGYRPAQLARDGNRPPAAAFVQDGLTALGKSGLAISTDALESAAKAKAIEAHAGFQNDALDLTSTLEKQLQAKEITREQMPELLTARLEEIKKKRLEGVATGLHDQVSAGFVGVEGQVRRAAEKAIELDLKQERVGSINNSLESLHRLALTDPQNAIRQAEMIIDSEGPGVLGADKVETAKQSFREKASYSYLSKQIGDNRDSIKGLQGVVARINTDEFANLDPDKRNLLVSHAESMIDRAQARAEAAAHRREAAIERGIKQVTQTALLGYPVDAGSLDALTRAAKGTAYEQDVAGLRTQIDYVRRFTQASPVQMEAELNRLDVEMHKPDARVTPELIGMREKLGSLYTNTKKILNENPMGYAVSRGQADLQPVDLSNLDSLKSQIQARAEVAYGLQRQYGAPLKVLFPEEARQLASVLRKAPVDQKVELLGILDKSIGDKNVYNATLQQIAPDSPVTALAGVHAGRGRMQVTNLMLRGESILRPVKSEDGTPDKGKLWPMPPEKDLRDGFSRYERDAFAGHPQARNDHYQAALSIYAAKSADAGDSSGDFNPDRWDQSIRLATGGIEKWNGRYTVMPYGMERGAFKDGLYGRIDQIAKNGRLADGVTASKLKDLPLEPIRDGQYVFRAGDGVLVGKDGKPVVIDFNAQAPSSDYKAARRVTDGDLTAQDRYQ